MAQRRKKRNKIASKNQSKPKSMDKVFDKLEMNMKKETKPYKVSNRNIKVATILIVLFSITGILYLSNINLVGQSNYTSEKGETLLLPKNMPSRYDNTLTQEPKLSSAYSYASTDTGEALLSQLICWCGCNDIAHSPYHENNKECFWSEDGTYEVHAETCSTCVYIALSAKTLYENNWTVSDIRTFIDDQYK